jgi:hypothetical protein
MMPTCPRTPLTKTSAIGAPSSRTAIMKGRWAENRRRSVSRASISAPGVL